MDTKSHTTLELPAVLEQLAGHAHFSASKSLARALTPTADLEKAIHRQQGTTEARRLLSLQLDLTIGGAHDVREAVTAAARGSVLDPEQFLEIKSTLISGRNLRRLFERMEESYPVLEQIVGGMEPANGLIDAISKTLDDRGEVLDRASTLLGECRRDMRVVRERVHTRLQRMTSDEKIATMLQEPIVTQRDGRYVIPLQAQFKGRVKGVIHDQSASGATLFIEPLQAVEGNNRLRELELTERDEIRRILLDLSQRVSAQQESIEATVRVLAEFDLALAKARFADRIDASEPVLKAFDGEDGRGSTLHILDARHPLLDRDAVVPIDLLLEKTAYAMIITGPNTGGKTVSLKTAGLLALMAQCGLHIPATSGSELSVFDSVCADIGDEQSIEQSLSTFSGHIANISRILEKATTKSLVLLDELGSGTDPQEGAALARAILDELIERRITTLIATHYPEMKVYAQSKPGAVNASMAFDLDTLQPTYRLVIGLPGRSNALAIAERLGLTPAVLERARNLVAPEDLRADELLDEIHHQRELSRRTLEDLEQTQERLSQKEQVLDTRLRELDEERRAVLDEARQRGADETESVREELRRLRNRLRAAAKPLDEVEAVDRMLSVVEKRVTTKVPAAKTKRPQRPLKVGDRVIVDRIQSEGVITSLGQEDAEIQIGNLRLRASLEELMHPDDGTGSASEPAPVGEPQAPSRGTPLPAPPPLELDLRGYRVDEAMDALEARLDAAFVSGMPYIRIIHGKGTGALRKAVRHALERHRLVKSSEMGKPSEGGDGVTIVKLHTS